MSDDGTRDKEITQYLTTTFLARVAHDIRGPAGVTLTALDELENALGPATAREHAALLAILRRSARRVLRVAEKLSRASEAANGPVLQPVRCRLFPIVEKALRDAETLEGRRNVTVILEATGNGSKERRDVVLGDPSWLETLMIEIVSNALKHARGRVVVALEETEGEVVVSVVDDGKAAIPKVRPLFEPSNERNGLGVSLSLADRVMRQTNGTLAVRPGPGGGCEVRLGFPKPDVPASADRALTPAEGPVPAPNGDLVLVVDDDADTVDLLAYALERAGFATSMARSLAEARVLLDERHPDALITDLSLPDGSGADIPLWPSAARLRAKILVSGHKGPTVDHDLATQGFDCQLVKPVDLDELIAVLSKNLGR
jgi:CheY-like chemotaxis protein